MSTASRPSLKSTWFISLLGRIWEGRKEDAVKPNESFEMANTNPDSDNLSELSTEAETSAITRKMSAQNGGTLIAGRRRNRAKRRA